MKTRISVIGVIIISTTIFMCNPIGNKPEVTLYGPWGWDIEKFVFIDLGQFESFDTLFSRVDEVFCEDSIPVIELVNECKYKYIPLIGRCSYNGMVYRLKERNVLRIVDEQFCRSDFDEVDSFDFILDQFIMNPTNREDKSESPKKALIIISYKDEGIDGLPELLERMTDAADRIGVTKYLHISIKKSIPPPPPRHISI